MKEFLVNLLRELQQKNYLVTNSVVYGFCRLLETEIANKRNINSIPFKETVQFFNKANFEEEQKRRIFNILKNIQEIFGKNLIQDFSPALVKEYEAYLKENEKEFQRLIQKFKLKNQEERK